MDGQSQTSARRARGKRSLLLNVAVIGGLCLSLVAFVQLYRWERQTAANQFGARFQLAAQEIYGAILRELGSDLQVLRALAALYEASEQVTRQEFHRFATNLLDSNDTIHALEWVPRVPNAARSRYEQDAWAAIPGFRITEMREDRTLIAALPRDEYYPVYFIEPYAGNESAVGLDLGAEPVGRETLQRALDTGQMAASGPMTLAGQVDGQYAFLACLPVYPADAPSFTVAQRRESLQGFVLSVWRFDRLVEKALSQFASQGIRLSVFDTTNPAEDIPLYRSPALGPRHGLPRPGAASARHFLEVGGRHWAFVATSEYGSYAPPPVYSAWLVLLTGLTITGLLFWYLRALQDHSRALQRTNRSLDREIGERRHADAALKSSEGTLRQVLESAGDVILICNHRGNILIANSQTERLFGYTRDEIIGQPVELLLPAALRERHSAHRADYLAHRNQRPMGGGLELIAQRKDGSLVPVEISLSPVQSVADGIITAIVRDISARKKAQAELHSLNRTHAVLARCAKSLAAARDETDLLKAYCRNLVEVGGYCYAAVDYAGDNQGNSLHRMAQAGPARGDCALKAASREGPRPGESAIATGKPVILRDLDADYIDGPSADAASHQGCRSVISLPLEAHDREFGSFSLFSAEPNAFNEEEVALLEELASDLSLGIATLRAQVDQEQRALLLREEVEQEEHKRIAATVHDGVGQSMQAVNLGLKRMRALADTDPQLARDLLDRIIEEVGGVLTELREISHDLRPLFLERMELRQAIQYHCSELQERIGTAIHLAYSQESFVLDARVKRQCFLCFREALNNAVRHAKASRIDVTLEAPSPDSLTIRVADDGVGFDPEQTSSTPSGLGLAMMLERAATIGGRASIQSTPDEGTAVTIRVPVTAPQVPKERRTSERRENQDKGARLLP